MAAAILTLDGGVPEEDVVVKQEEACCNRDVGVPEEDVEGKLVGPVRTGSNRCPHVCQT